MKVKAQNQRKENQTNKNGKKREKADGKESQVSRNFQLNVFFIDLRKLIFKVSIGVPSRDPTTLIIQNRYFIEFSNCFGGLEGPPVRIFTKNGPKLTTRTMYD